MRTRILLTLVAVVLLSASADSMTFTRPKEYDKIPEIDKYEKKVLSYLSGYAFQEIDKKGMKAFEELLLPLYEKYHFQPNYMVVGASWAKQFPEKVKRSDSPFPLKASVLYLIGDYEHPEKKDVLKPKEIEQEASSIELNVQLLCMGIWQMSQKWVDKLQARMEAMKPYGYDLSFFFGQHPAWYEKLMSNPALTKENRQILIKAFGVDKDDLKMLTKVDPKKDDKIEHVQKFMADVLNRDSKIKEASAEKLLTDLKDLYTNSYWSVHWGRKRHSVKKFMEACQDGGVSEQTKDRLLVYMLLPLNKASYIIANRKLVLIDEARSLLNEMLTGKKAVNVENMVELTNRLMDLEERFDWKIYNEAEGRELSNDEEDMIEGFLGSSVDEGWRKVIFGF